ncbi:AAA family ATPase [Polynucleobacter sp. MWH-UH23A]|uniref:AAA family ATPase n=1 Tax=Polynucleobacter sp. MWH-UH23A TaxID=1855613 RepID=UPI003364EDDB
MGCNLSPSAPRLIVFAGHSGTGKSTLAKKALPLIIEKTGEAFFLLDKDTVFGAYSAHVMELTTNNPNDRDSPYFLKNLRDWEYSGIVDIARENLMLGVNIILDAPFSSEIKSGKMFSPAALGIPTNTIIRLAWIDLIENEAKRRIENRANARDEWKLAHWEQYRVRRTEPPENPSLFRFDNLNFDTKKFERLVDCLTN